MYLVEQVVPTQYGVRKHPFFCFGRKSKISASEVDEVLEIDESPDKIPDKDSAVKVGSWYAVTYGKGFQTQESVSTY